MTESVIVLKDPVAQFAAERINLYCGENLAAVASKMAAEQESDGTEFVEILVQIPKDEFIRRPKEDELQRLRREIYNLRHEFTIHDVMHVLSETVNWRRRQRP